jgi:hypothetical protein
MSPVTRRTTKLAVATVLSAVSLTGCAGLRPGVAAKVGDDTITTRALDDFASSFCAFQAKRGQPMTSSDARESALTVMIRGRLAKDLDQQLKAVIDQGLVEQQVDSVAKTVAGLDKDKLKAFVDQVRQAIVGDLVVEQAAVAAVRGAGEEPGADNVGAAKEKIYATWAQSEGVELDPRFGTLKNVVVTPASGSLSVSTGAEADKSLPGAKTCG